MSPFTVMPVLSGHSKKKIGFQDRLSLNAGQTYCRMPQESILQYFRPSFSYHISFKTFVLSFIEWPLKTGFTVIGCDVKLISMVDIWSYLRHGTWFWWVFNLLPWPKHSTSICSFLNVCTKCMCVARFWSTPKDSVAVIHCKRSVILHQNVVHFTEKG